MFAFNIVRDFNERYLVKIRLYDAINSSNNLDNFISEKIICQKIKMENKEITYNLSNKLSIEDLKGFFVELERSFQEFGIESFDINSTSLKQVGILKKID